VQIELRAAACRSTTEQHQRQRQRGGRREKRERGSPQTRALEIDEPPAIVAAMTMSRSGSRIASITIRPRPVRRCTTGSSTGSPIVPHDDRIACETQKANMNKAASTITRRR
jgi:hypothetical protein